MRPLIGFSPMRWMPKRRTRGAGPGAQQDPSPKGSKLSDMSETISRRGLVKRVAGAAVGLAAPAAVGAFQQPQTARQARLDAELAAVEAQLARPLSPEVQALTRQAVASNLAAADQRLRFKLPENSEPCTRFEAVRPTDLRLKLAAHAGPKGVQEQEV